MQRYPTLAALLLAHAIIQASAASAFAAPPAIIPAPVEMTVHEGFFEIGSQTKVMVYDHTESRPETISLIDALAPALGRRLPITTEPCPESSIVLSLDPSLEKDLGAEGYKLRVSKHAILMRAANPAGLFYAVQTLRQLLPPDILRQSRVSNVRWTVPCCEITDYPRFPWRGLLIDPARHFIPKRDVMRYIDAMALHKFNRLQIHFTDGQGWRIEIEQYPFLTEIGSLMHNSMQQRGDKARIYGGFYTQDDIRELVRYARERHVTLVPEIEMPFHAGAAMVAYPELGFDPETIAALPPAERWGRVGNLVVPRPATVAFMKNVLDEVMDMFPGEYIHIGGDEANANRWADLPEMQEQMEELGLEDVHELHSWFIRQMNDHIAERGRRMIGWGEILQGGLAEGATVMSWRSPEAGVAAARAGSDVIMALTSHTYFDYGQSQDMTNEPPGFGSALITLDKVYTFEPVPAQLEGDAAARILGGQGQLWGERIPNERHREYQTYPRACALIETLWTPPESRDYEGFHDRLQKHTKRLDAAGIYYRALDPRP